jgi:8-oxo-dGTP diphosphatase
LNKEFIESAFGKQIRVRVSGILYQNNRILFIKHLQVGKDYLWAPPGGGLNYGETIHECLIREFKEETGLNVQVGKFLNFHEFIDLPLHAVELFFEVFTDNLHIILGKDPELSHENQIMKEIKFLSIDDLRKEKPDNLHQLAFHFFENYSPNNTVI